MAQKNTPTQGRRAPVYSADSMAVRMVIGTLLIALGLLILFSVIPLFRGSVFSGVRQVAGGLAGALSFLLPVIPIWGGALVFLSIYRKPPIFSFVMMCLLMLLLTAAMVLVSLSGSPAIPLMDYIHQQHVLRFSDPDAFSLFLSYGWNLGMTRGLGGGAIGMLIAWPLWQTLGVVGGAIVCILLAIVAAMAMLHITPAKLSGALQSLRERQQARRAERAQQQHAQELQWQQEQAWRQQQQQVQQLQQQQMQRQQQMQQQQQLQQQMQQQFQQPPYQPPYEQPAWYGAPAGWTAPVAEQPPAQAAAKKRKAAAEAQPQEDDALQTGKPSRRSIFEVIPPDPPAEAAEPAAKNARQRREKPGSDAGAAASPARSRRGGVVRPPEKELPPDAAPPLDTAPQQTAPQLQKPLDSWAETPPWEEDPDDVCAVEVVQPVLQQPKPQGVWQPELKIPPQSRRQPRAEQTEMTLPLPYTYPGLDLLASPTPQSGIDPEEDTQRTRSLEAMLESFRVPAKVRHITHGPAISRFELELAPGINVTKVTSLAKNIAMCMRVKTVRIEAPIPGTPYIGVEVPNVVTDTVTLREVLESDAMRKASKPLIVALGKDIAGKPILCDLVQMPHLLIAGATGSGKSVCINTIINSLLYRCSPREVRLILIDPKVVELQCYNNLPHLLVPVVSDAHKASGALAWAVGEMLARYKMFEPYGARNIDGYNARLPDGEEPLPRIVIIIDELADLMMTCKKDVEDRICRLAQLARAAGVHLIVATQRPSVDVITGLIKANINSRIAFKVNSNVDSRTILDRIGAENLLGHGDMLYKPMSESDPIRVQGCFLTDDEVNRITDFIRTQNPSDYDARILSELDHLQAESQKAAQAAQSAQSDESDDETALSDLDYLIQAIEIAVASGQLSTSHLQRRLKLGYARAGRIMDEMEKRQIVSAKDGAKPRRCLITREQFEQMLENGELDIL